MFGDQAAANLEKEGVSREYIIRTTESHTGAAIIVVDDSVENLIVVAGGANNLVSVEDVELARQAIARSDVLLVQLEVPLAAVERALRIAKEAGN